MSGWNDYISTYLTPSGSICQAGIYGRANMQVYANLGDLQLQQYNATVNKEGPKGDVIEVTEPVYEDHNLINWLTTKEKPAQGFRIAQVKYQLLRTGGEDETPILYLKCSGGAACVAVTNTLVIIGIYKSEMEPPSSHAACNKAVEDLAELLKGSGY